MYTRAYSRLYKGQGAGMEKGNFEQATYTERTIR